MAYLFGTDALSESMRRRPRQRSVYWLSTIPRHEQYTSAIVLGELFAGALRSFRAIDFLAKIDQHVTSRMGILPFDASSARVFGEIKAVTLKVGATLDTADLQIAATALQHGHTVVTGNLRHFQRVPGIRVHRILADARRDDELSAGAP